MFKVRKIELYTLSRFRMVDEKHEGACFAPPPPRKDRVKFVHGRAEIGVGSKNISPKKLYTSEAEIAKGNRQNHDFLRKRFV